jgi:hypothetical protein
MSEGVESSLRMKLLYAGESPLVRSDLCICVGKLGQATTKGCMGSNVRALPLRNYTVFILEIRGK